MIHLPAFMTDLNGVSVAAGLCLLLDFFFFADISNLTSLCFHLNDQRDLSLFVLQLMLEILEHPL